MYDDRFTDGYLVGSSNGNNNNGWNDWSWIIALALIGGLGNGGFGFGNGNNRGTCATQADLSAGFNNSAVLSNLNDIILGQAQMQNFINQGFNGVQNTLTTSFANLNTNLCSLGYNQAQLVNGLSRELADCCCSTKGAIADLKYANERQTCDIISAINAGNQRLVDIYTNDKIETLNRKLSTAEAQLSNNAQSRYIVDTVLDKLSPCPKPAFVVQPPQQVTFPTNCCGNVAYANFGYNGSCGTSVV